MSTQEKPRYDIKYKYSETKERLFHILGTYTPNISQDKAVYSHVEEEDSYVVNKHNRVLAKNERNWGDGCRVRCPIGWFDKTRYNKIFENKRIIRTDTARNAASFPPAQPQSPPVTPILEVGYVPFPDTSATYEQQIQPCSSETQPYTQTPIILTPLTLLKPEINTLWKVAEYSEEICPVHLDFLGNCTCSSHSNVLNLGQHLGVDSLQ